MTGLTEHKTRLYAIRTDASSATVVMDCEYLNGFMGMWFACVGVVATGSILTDLTSPESRPELLYNWPGSLAAFVTCVLFALFGGGLTRSVIDLRSIIVTPGRATVAWRLFRAPIRSLTFNVRFVVVHQDVWRGGNGSTDRVILQGQEQMHTVATVWNVPPIGSFKPLYDIGRLGAASEPFANGATNGERTVSPLILDLAKTLASAASVPIVLRARETRRPWLSIGGESRDFCPHTPRK